MTSVDEDVEPSYTNGRLVIWYNHLRNSLAGSQMTKYWVIIWPSKLSPSCISTRNENTCEGRNRDADREQTCGHGGVGGTECSTSWEWHWHVYTAAAAAAAESLQSCLTLFDPMDCSPPGSPIPGILQARTLEWVAFPSPIHESERGKGSRSVMFDTSRPHGLQPTRLLYPWDFPGKSTGVGCHCLLLVGG